MSTTGSEIIRDKIALITSMNGILIKKVIPVANNLRSFKRIKLPNIIHAYTMEISAITAPKERT